MSHDVTIVDSGGANLASLQHALTRLGASSTVSNDVAEIAAARRVLLPGVGSAALAMQRLRDRALDKLLPGLRQPVLGVCLGMQLLYEHSAEGDTACLGILPGKVSRLTAEPKLPVPHMGWNTTTRRRNDALLEALGDEDRFYFVHSYAAPATAATTATCEYGGEFAAVVERDNFHGVQFHPERSGPVGARLLANFLRV